MFKDAQSTNLKRAKDQMRRATRRLTTIFQDRDRKFVGKFSKVTFTRSGGALVEFQVQPEWVPDEARQGPNYMDPVLLLGQRHEAVNTITIVNTFRNLIEQEIYYCTLNARLTRADYYATALKLAPIAQLYAVVSSFDWDTTQYEELNAQAQETLRPEQRTQEDRPHTGTRGSALTEAIRSYVTWVTREPELNATKQAQLLNAIHVLLPSVGLYSIFPIAGSFSPTVAAFVYTRELLKYIEKKKLIPVFSKNILERIDRALWTARIGREGVEKLMADVQQFVRTPGLLGNRTRWRHLPKHTVWKLYAIFTNYELDTTEEFQKEVDKLIEEVNKKRAAQRKKRLNRRLRKVNAEG